MKDIRRTLFGALSLCASLAFAPASTPTLATGLVHPRGTDWINATPLTPAALRGKIVRVQFWSFECVNGPNSSAWAERVEGDKGGAGLVLRHACGEMHLGQDAAQGLEQALDLLLAAPPA